MQGALRLLAIQDVRMLLEEGGLDWKALQAVAAGDVEPGTEVRLLMYLPWRACVSKEKMRALC